MCNIWGANGQYPASDIDIQHRWADYEFDWRRETFAFEAVVQRHRKHKHALVKAGLSPPAGGCLSTCAPRPYGTTLERFS